MGAVLISIVLQVPLIIASAVLLIAALLKMRKEKGSILFLLGALLLAGTAVGTFLATLVLFSMVSGVLLPPSLLVDREFGSIIFLALGAVDGALRAVAILLLSVGTFLRRPAPRPAKT